jgi:hypothetical protein
MGQVNQQSIQRGHDAFAEGGVPTPSKSETDNLTEVLLLRFSCLRGAHHGGRLARLGGPRASAQAPY